MKLSLDSTLANLSKRTLSFRLHIRAQCDSAFVGCSLLSSMSRTILESSEGLLMRSTTCQTIDSIEPVRTSHHRSLLSRNRNKVENCWELGSDLQFRGQDPVRRLVGSINIQAGIASSGNSGYCSDRISRTTACQPNRLLLCNYKAKLMHRPVSWKDSLRVTPGYGHDLNIATVSFDSCEMINVLKLYFQFDDFPHFEHNTTSKVVPSSLHIWPASVPRVSRCGQGRTLRSRCSHRFKWCWPVQN